MTRTLPLAFPLLRSRDGYAGRALRADMVRRIAHAQNYLYANLRRVYSNGGSEGNGYHVDADFGAANDAGNPYWQPNIPGNPAGGGGGVPIARFMCPPNWGASQRLKIQGQWYVRGNCTLTATVEELDGRPLSIVAATTDGDEESTPNDWDLELTMPGRLAQVTLWVSCENTGFETNGPTVLWVSARYREANADELFGDTPHDYQLHWMKRDDHATRNSNSYVDAWITRTLIRNALALWGDRPMEVYQAWLGGIGRNYGIVSGGSPKIFAVHKYWVPKGLATIGYRIDYEWLPSGATAMTLTLKRNGSTVATHSSISTSGHVSGTFSPGSSGAEDTFTIEITFTGAPGSTDYNSVLSGVFLWEEAYDMGALNAGSIPDDYTPIDEDKLVADALVTYGAGNDLATLLMNDTWLYKHRVRGLVGDWRRRILKRVDYENIGGANFVHPFWDWTRGSIISDYQDYPGRNITIMGGADAQDDVDGLTKYNHGLADSYSTGSNTGGWIESGTWRRAGRRLLQVPLTAPSGLSLHRTNSKGRVSVYVRGRRLETFTVPSSSYKDTGGTERMRGAEGPRVERINFSGQASFEIDYPKTSLSTSRLVLSPYAYELESSSIAGSSKFAPRKKRTDLVFAEAPDAVQQWIGPAVQAHNPDTGGDDDLMRVRGRCPEKAGQPLRTSGARAEGLLFEVELNQAFVMDVPLGQDALDAEPSPGTITF